MLKLETAINKDKQNEEKGKITYITFLIVGEEKLVKIATTVNPIERIIDVIVKERIPVYIYGCIKEGYVEERDYHLMFKKKEVRPKIFELNNSEMKIIQEDCEKKEAKVNYQKLIGEFIGSYAFNYIQGPLGLRTIEDTRGQMIEALINRHMTPKDRLNKFLERYYIYKFPPQTFK